MSKNMTYHAVSKLFTATCGQCSRSYTTEGEKHECLARLKQRGWTGGDREQPVLLCPHCSRT